MCVVGRQRSNSIAMSSNLTSSAIVFRFLRLYILLRPAIYADEEGHTYLHAALNAYAGYTNAWLLDLWEPVLRRATQLAIAPGLPSCQHRQRTRHTSRFALPHRRCGPCSSVAGRSSSLRNPRSATQEPRRRRIDENHVNALSMRPVCRFTFDLRSHEKFWKSFFGNHIARPHPHAAPQHGAACSGGHYCRGCCKGCGRGQKVKNPKRVILLNRDFRVRLKVRYRTRISWVL